MEKGRFEYLSDNEYKLFRNICAYKSNEGGIAELPFNGDGFQSSVDRYYGYLSLKKHGLITFDEKKFNEKSLITHAHVILLVKCD